MRRNKNNGWSSDGHVPDETLLLGLSGELSSQELDAVREHLDGCWTCRVRSDKFEQAIQSVVDYRDEVVKQHLPLPSAPRAMLLARLEEAAREVERKTFWQKARALILLPSQSQLFRPFALAALCIVLFVAVIGRWPSRTIPQPKISADDLLARADSAEKKKLSDVNHPVEYREVSISYNGHVAKKAVYHDIVSNKTVAVNTSSQAVQPEVESKLENSQFDVRDPLSVPAFIAWRSKLAQRRDDIIHSANGLITVQTTTLGGPLREVALTLRDSDFHPMSESFRFADESSLEIAEVNYDVLPFAKVESGVFNSAPPSRAVVPAHLSVGPSTRDLLDAEVKARVVLHVLGADLGEQVEVSTDEEKRRIVVSGLVETATRKEELLRALETVPFAQLQLTSVDETKEEYVDEPSINRFVVANGFGSPLDSRLASTFPDPSVRAEFVNSTFNQARKALSTAWALRRLSDRYSSDVAGRLSPNAQRELEMLIRAQLTLLQSQLDGLGKSLTPVLVQVSPTTDGSANEVSDWHWLVDRAFSSTERIHSDVAVLLSGSMGDKVDRDAIISDLRNQLERMSIQLPAFSRRVSGRFLSPSQLNAEVQ